MNFYGLKEPAVGTVTNMYAIAEKLTKAGKVDPPIKWIKGCRLLEDSKAKQECPLYDMEMPQIFGFCGIFETFYNSISIFCSSML